MRVLVVATDVVPSAGPPAREEALRTWGLVQGLRAHGHEVEASVPSDAAGRVHEIQPDVVLCGDWRAATFPARITQPLVIDLAGPPLLDGAVRETLRALSSADFFIVSGARQRLHFLSFLLRAGIERPETRTLTIPMPLSPDVPSRARGGTPADGFPRLVTTGVGTFAELLTQLASADVALDVAPWSLERELTVPIRSTACLWSGLPVIHNDYDDLAGLIRKYDAGWTIPPSDPPARVLDEIAANPETVARKGQSASRLAREVFSWDRAVEPLLAALRAEPRPEVDFDLARPDDTSLTVLAGRPVEQRFLSRIDGLRRVEFCLATHGRERLQEITVSLYRLAGDDARELLVAKTVPGDAIRDNEWLALEVERRPDSAGCAFALAIESKATREEESVSPWASSSRPFPLLDLYHAGLRLGGTSLCLRVSAEPQS